MYRFVVVVSAVCIVCGGRPALAQVPPFTPGQVLRADDLNVLVDQLNSNTAAHTGAASAQVIVVDCASGDTIAQALQQALPGATLQLSGTCTEALTITTDGLTLDGQSVTVITGSNAEQPVITVDGAQRVTLRNLTVQQGSDGILAVGGAAVTLDGVTAQGNTDEGIEIRANSTAIFIDVTTQQNTDNGIMVTEASSITFQNTIISNDNGDDGILIYQGSNAKFDGATVQTNNNGDSGLNITVSSGSLFLNSTFTMNNNTSQGMRLLKTSSLDCNHSTISSNQNGGPGILIFQGATLSLFSCAVNATANTFAGLYVVSNAAVYLSGSDSNQNPVVLDNNTVYGLSVVRSSRFDKFDDALMSVTGNTNSGVYVDDASIRIQDATITGNGAADVNLVFGSRATLNNNTIGSISCDGTALSRGTTVCP